VRRVDGNPHYPSYIHGHGKLGAALAEWDGSATAT